MSKIKTQLCQTDAQYRINMSIYDLYIGDYNNIIIRFIDEHQETADILSTSHGSINDNNLHIQSKINLLTVDVLYPDRSQHLSGIIAYYKDDEMVHCENAAISLPRKPITLAPITPRSIEMDNLPKDSSYFTNKLGLSKWKIEIIVEEDILLTAVSFGQKPTLVVFGEKSLCLNHSDIIFTLYPDVKQVVLPKEMILSRYESYDSTELGCYELVTIVPYAINNLYYKLPISNNIECNRIARSSNSLQQFTLPTGSELDPQAWVIGKLGLPEKIT